MNHRVADHGRQRPYHSELREARAEQTRLRVVRAAAELFARDGYAGTSLRGIASAAGVSLERVTAAGSKADLLLAAFRQTFAGSPDASEAVVPDQPPVPASDLQGTIAPAIREIVGRMGHSLGIWRAMTAAAATEQPVAAARAEMVGLRRSQIVDLVRELERARLVHRRTHARRRRVADAVGLVVSHEAYDQLVTLCGWSERAYADWAVDTVTSQLAGCAH